jgi:AmiR/NasT family two-component response regulator
MGNVCTVGDGTANGSEAIWQVARAQGMVSAQAHCTLDSALVLMRNTARATDETFESIATRVVEGGLRFE